MKKPEPKKFECVPRCEELNLEGVTFSCPKCIKRTMFPLTEKQRLQILKILNLQ